MKLVKLIAIVLTLWSFGGITYAQPFLHGPSTPSETGPGVPVCRESLTAGDCDDSLWDELTFLLAIDGSKQPQDFGVNANLGVNASFGGGIPLAQRLGIGAQVGTGITASAKAIRAYELLGKSTGRVQNFTTVGLFQRLNNAWSYGFAHDFLYQKSFDSFCHGQWRLRASYELFPIDHLHYDHAALVK